MNPLIPNAERRVMEEMLAELGISSVDELYSDIPDEVRLDRKLDIPPSLTELELERHLDERLSRDPELVKFLGGGSWLTHVPRVVSYILERGEFLTSYTPYQAEVSQGMLQSLYEYQSLVCELTGLEVANSSNYDWASATAEACLMATRVTNRDKVLLADNVSPKREEVIETYGQGTELEVEKVESNIREGGVLLDGLEESLDDQVAALYLENPAYNGAIQLETDAAVELTHDAGALLIVGVDPLSLGLLRPPGDYGADIAVGEGQPLGDSPSYGGPLLGIFATRGESRLIRETPGRIIGETTTQDGGSTAYSMILQTREQHIRRARATSNICTNQALLAVAAAVYLSLLGPRGLRELAEHVTRKAHYLAARLNEIDGVDAPPYQAPFFRDFEVSLPNGEDAAEVLERGLKEGYVLGWREEGGARGSYLTSVSEVHSKEDLDGHVRVLRETLRG